MNRKYSIHSMYIFRSIDFIEFQEQLVLLPQSDMIETEKQGKYGKFGTKYSERAQ